MTWHLQCLNPYKAITQLSFSMVKRVTTPLHLVVSIITDCSGGHGDFTGGQSRSVGQGQNTEECSPHFLLSAF